MAAPSDIPWPEHPRPDFKREPWINLNGPWDFAFDPDDKGEKEQWFVPGKHKFDKTITVPFPWESKLSGIGDTEYKGVAWYQRSITLPKGDEWKNRDAWLVIGACDFKAKVWINGQLATEHVGGYTPFDVNLSKFAKPGEKATLIIRAEDKTDPHQPTGKQVHWYTRTSGIWQTVYMEPRGSHFIRSLKAQCDLKKGTVTYTIELNAPCHGRLNLTSPESAFDLVQWGLPGNNNTVQIPLVVKNPKAWSPDSPALYPVRFELRLADAPDAEGIADVVDSYFGLREISVGKAPGGDYQYITLNGQPIYLLGALHQSFHPDGIYQYPDDATMRSDYELCKRIGLNFLRIHIKPPVPRELYWADKLGVMIMQDMPNTWEHSDEARKWWQETMEATVQRDFNHPATIAWCDFNETWGIGGRDGYNRDIQKWVLQMYQRTKQLDPTRLVEDNSPCFYDHVATDINSWHFYINDYDKARDHIREVVEKTYPGSDFNFAEGYKQDDAPLINSEYGGISAGKGDQDISWCFKYLTNELRLHDKIGGYVYTELSDIEWEHNGFVNYDRSAKEYGYDFWHPGFTLADINNPDFVAIDAPPMIELKPGEKRDIPIKISHWSHHEAKSLQLLWRTDWYDSFGRRTAGDPKKRPATWKPFQVIDAAPVTLTAPERNTGRVGVLMVELVDGKKVLARNYVNLWAKQPAAPRVEVVDPQTLALRFKPDDYAAWTFKSNSTLPQKVAGPGAGSVEYRLTLPDKLPLADVTGIEVVAELASKADNEKLDWPARKKDVDYPQTDVTKWPTDVTLTLNDQDIAAITLADDPADARGALSHHRGQQGSYGYLTRTKLTEHLLTAVIETLREKRQLHIRWEVPETAMRVGGLTIYGETLGRYPVDPTILLTFDKNHGLGKDFASDQPIVIDRIVQ